MPASGNVRSILAMLAAVAFFSVMDTVLKLLSAHYPALQVAALRGLTALPLVVLYVAWRREGHTLLKVRWPLHLLRGLRPEHLWGDQQRPPSANTPCSESHEQASRWRIVKAQTGAASLDAGKNTRNRA